MVILDLGMYFNCDGVSSDANRMAGNFDAPDVKDVYWLRNYEATVFVGLGAYGVIDIAGWYLTKQNEWGVILHYVLPLEPKYWFAYPGIGRYLGAAALIGIYTAAYLAIGWIFLRRRDL